MSSDPIHGRMHSSTPHTTTNEASPPNSGIPVTPPPIPPSLFPPMFLVLDVAVPALATGLTGLRIQLDRHERIIHRIHLQLSVADRALQDIRTWQASTSGSIVGAPLPDAACEVPKEQVLRIHSVNLPKRPMMLPTSVVAFREIMQRERKNFMVGKGSQVQGFHDPSFVGQESQGAEEEDKDDKRETTL